MSRKHLGVFVVLVCLACAQPLLAQCDMCRPSLECNPNCELIERCKPADRFPQAGGECFYSMYGCTVTNFCGWAGFEASPANDLLAELSIRPLCPPPGASRSAS